MHLHFGDISELIAPLDLNSKYSKIFVMLDTNTELHCLPLINEAIGTSYDIIEIAPGEDSKDIDIAIGVWRTLLDFEADRHILIINLGGGVVSDFGGFIAATYKRGVDFINIPTTLMGMADAGIGGKTGINLDVYKNIIGTFTMPKEVLIDTAFLNTLPKRELLAGYAEVVKHALIAEKTLFDLLINESHATLSIEEIVEKSARLKASIVAQDPTETGIRQILNYGHTIGHAIESYSLVHDDAPLIHGEAVAIGLWVETWLSHKLGQLNDEDWEKCRTLILKYLPSQYQLSIEAIPALLDIMQNDKKNKDGHIKMVLLNGISSAIIQQTVSETDISDALTAYFQ